MNLDPEKTQLIRDGEGIYVVVDGQRLPVWRVALAFPQTHPDRFVGFLNLDGREIGMVKDPEGLDSDSLALLRAELKTAYFVPTVQCIRSVVHHGTSSVWEVETDDGDQTFRIPDRDSLDGSEAPAIKIRDAEGKRYRIEDYWDLDSDSKEMIKDLLPRQIRGMRFEGHGKGSRSRGPMVMGFR